MSYAWETTEDDVRNVLNRCKVRASARKIIDDLDHDAIESAALQGNEMDEQTDLAYAEIQRQLVELEIVKN